MRKRVAVTGLGLVNPFILSSPPAPGYSAEPVADLADFFDRICAGESAIRLYVTNDIPRPIRVPAVWCADFQPDKALGKPLAGMMERFGQLGLTSALAAWRDAGLDSERTRDTPPSPDRGVAWGSALGGLSAFERGYREFWLHGRERVAPMSVVLGMNNAAAAHMSIQLGLGNCSLTYSVACASATVAIGEAFERIRSGAAKVMLAGGSDATLAYAVVRAWEALRVLAPGNETSAPSACRPFHSDRAGLVLGEGAAALVLEDWEHAVSRGARIYAELAGYGCTSDSSHLVRPDARGQAAAMRMALEQAGLGTADIGYINAHGTATREGDPTEVDAIRRVFGAHAQTLPVSATKGAHGHMMGATGAIEALITVMAIASDTLPPTAHLDQVDSACEGVCHIQGQALTGRGVKAALSNSFAFGGTNAVLAFKLAA